jgi:hypothetical protein
VPLEVMAPLAGFDQGDPKGRIEESEGQAGEARSRPEIGEGASSWKVAVEGQGGADQLAQDRFGAAVAGQVDPDRPLGHEFGKRGEADGDVLECA